MKWSGIGRVIAICVVSAQGMAEEELELSLEEVPEVVLSAVRAAKPGIRITEADLLRRDSGDIYAVDGRLGVREYEVWVTPGGEVLRIILDE